MKHRHLGGRGCGVRRNGVRRTGLLCLILIAVGCSESDRQSIEELFEGIGQLLRGHSGSLVQVNTNDASGPLTAAVTTWGLQGGEARVDFGERDTTLDLAAQDSLLVYALGDDPEGLKQVSIHREIVKVCTNPDSGLQQREVPGLSPGPLDLEPVNPEPTPGSPPSQAYTRYYVSTQHLGERPQCPTDLPQGVLTYSYWAEATNWAGETLTSGRLVIRVSTT